MKSSLTCPKCRSHELWVIDEVKEADLRVSGVVAPMPVTAVRLEPDGRLGRWLEDYKGLRVGKFEAWVCASCGFTEWYAKDMNEGLAMLAELPGSGVRRLSKAARGPFR